ncbi:MAG: VCBS repeat-containing protein [Verrucomicrobia bacterium]|nr:VCBS repeat-containing protein [Verrucomicrobiota bacterium]
MFKFPLAFTVFVLGATTICAKDYAVQTFKKIRLSDQFWGEGANFGDFNHDNYKDIVSGPYWYEGPDFKKRHEYYPANKTFKRKKNDGTEEAIQGFEGALGTNNAYSDNFFAFAYDFNNDGWDDILILGFPGQDASWYENPKGREGLWQRHKVFDVVDNESPTWGDLTGDGKPELICNSGGYFGFAEPDWSDTTKPWTFHRISPKGDWQRFTHGLGYGDVNGDGRKDILELDGWWEQPASLSGDPVWTKHQFPFAPGHGSSQMYVYDVNGDGLNDVITSLAAHGYGLAWYEQVRENGIITFKQHSILNKEQKPSPNKYGVTFSQLHAVDLVDMDGDGLKDIITGKRFWAHGPAGDPEPNAPAVLYWFKLVRNKDKSVDFIPYLIDNDSGIGTQVVAGDINGDKRPDVVVGNKKGTFVFLQQTKKVSKAEWEKSQPKLLSP